MATSTLPVTLRDRVGEDAPALGALADAHFGDRLPGVPADILALQGRARDRGYREAHPSAEDLVIEVAGEVAGRLLVDRSGRAEVLVDIVVHPALRGRGLGTAALEAWLAQVDGRGSAVRLCVEPLSPARRWYERHGFTQDDGAGDDPVRTTMRREANR